MKNRIDLGKYQVRTDLIIENIDVGQSKENVIIENVDDSVRVTTVNVDGDLESKLNKKKGTYVTIEFEDATNHEDCVEIENVFSREVGKLLDKLGIKDDDMVLVVGLGNRNSTADSLGPKVIDKIMVTRHLFCLGTDVKEGIRSVAAVAPGVMASTGIETCDTITSIINKIKPSLLIAIDSLASSSISRINKTIQLTDTGIHPGSGVGNNREELSMNTIGIPVIAVGIPTVVESSIIVNDTINYLFKHLSYVKNNFEMNKLVFRHNKNYLDKIDDGDLSLDEKKAVSGMLGELDEGSKRELINEVLTSLDYNLIVTPKEIDFLVDNLSKIVALGLDKALHKAVSK